MKKLVVVLPLLLGLAGCGGGSSHSTPVPVVTPGVAGGSGTAQVSIVIGGKTAASTKRHLAYISPSMQAVSISVNGGTVVSQGCVSACTMGVSIPVGSATIVAKTYDATNIATAKLLSVGTLTTTVTTGTTSLTIPTGAVVDSVHSAATIVASDADVLSSALVNGTASIGGALADADNNPIPGGTLLAPIVFDNNSSSTVTGVSATPVTSTSDTVAYTYSATGNGTLRARDVTTGNVLATLTLMPAPYFVFAVDATTGALTVVSPARQAAVGTFALGATAGGIAVNAAATKAYITNPSGGSVWVVDVTHKNAPALSSTISGFAANPNQIAIDATHSRLYVGILDPAVTNSGLQHVPITGGTPVTDYTTTYAGNVVVDNADVCVYGPVYGRNNLGNGDGTGFDVFQIGSPGTDNGFTSATNVAILLTSADSQHVYTLPVPGSFVQIFDVGAGCAITANATPTVSQGTAGGNPKGMAINRTSTKLFVGSAGGNPNLAMFTISGGVPGSEQDFSVNSGLDSGFGFYNSAVAADGKIWVFDNFTGSLHVIDAGTATPTEPAWSPLGVTGSVIAIAP